MCYERAGLVIGKVERRHNRVIWWGRRSTTSLGVIGRFNSPAADAVSIDR
jgi:hypothetical protein